MHMSGEAERRYESTRKVVTHTWVIFEETGLPRVETSMSEHLQPDTFIFDDWQRRQIFLCNVRPTNNREARLPTWLKTETWIRRT